MALKSRMRSAEALECFRRAHAIDPENREAWLQMASALELLNRPEESADLIRQARARFQDWKLSVLEIRLARRMGDLDSALALVESKIALLREDNPANAQFFFEAAALYDDKSDPERAFDLFEKGNKCQSLSEAARALDKTVFPEMVKRHAAAYSRAWIESWTPAPIYDALPRPVFIIGFPRSGTTLLDHILFSHPDIGVAEEIPAVTAAINHSQKLNPAPYPERLAGLSPDHIEELRYIYFETMEKNGVNLEKPVLIDKQPLNMANAGMVYRLFPGAKIILVLRHPCDCVLSCFMQHFVPNMATAHFMDLKDASVLYDTVFSAWEEYATTLPLSVHTVRYENLVSDFRTEIGKVLDFIDLPWDDNLLDFNKKTAARGEIRTASYNQVGQKIYSRASYRWTRYHAQIAPVLDILKPWAKKFGYET